jgi:hypothetical protein
LLRAGRLSEIYSNTLLLAFSTRKSYSSFVLKSIEDGCQVDSICTDFDKVRHRLLLDEMSTDFEPSRCHFSGRIQRLRIGDCVSRNILVTSGVPQGSHLGPLCFIWFVNEIPRIFRHVRVLLYADEMNFSFRYVVSLFA